MNTDPELNELLPHRPPMTLLAKVIDVNTPGVAVALADTSPESVFYDAEVGGVPACVALEYMAQTMALAVGAECRRNGERPKAGFVLGTRRMDVKVAAFVKGERYVVTARRTFADDRSAAFDCRIDGPGGDMVAEASLSASRPPDAADGPAEGGSGEGGE